MRQELWRRAEELFHAALELSPADRRAFLDAACGEDTELRRQVEVRAGAIRCENRAHFLALCAQMMRCILVDHARHRGFSKRGGDAQHVPLDDVLLAAGARGIEVLALDETLDTLARIDPRKSRVVEMRYFGGLSIEETAEVLEVSPDTARRDWRMARAWPFAELTGKRSGS